ITANFSGEEQGRAFGIWAVASGATTILGPVVGGFLVDSISWRAAFLVNVPLILIALWATYAHVPESRDEEATGQFDWLGSVIVALAVGGLAFGVIYGQQRDWRDPVGFIALAVGVIFTAILPLWMARAPHPPPAAPLAHPAWQAGDLPPAAVVRHGPAAREHAVRDRHHDDGGAAHHGGDARRSRPQFRPGLGD